MWNPGSWYCSSEVEQIISLKNKRIQEDLQDSGVSCLWTRSISTTSSSGRISGSSWSGGASSSRSTCNTSTQTWLVSRDGLAADAGGIVPWKQVEGKSKRELRFHRNIYCRGGIFYIHAITILHNINLPNIPIYSDAISLSESNSHNKHVIQWIRDGITHYTTGNSPLKINIFIFSFVVSRAVKHWSYFRVFFSLNSCRSHKIYDVTASSRSHSNSSGCICHWEREGEGGRETLGLNRSQENEDLTRGRRATGCRRRGYKDDGEPHVRSRPSLRGQLK